MLQYTVDVLQKVSFNSSLFNKELKKSLQWLSQNEIEILKRWISIYIQNKPSLKDSLLIITSY